MNFSASFTQIDRRGEQATLDAWEGMLGIRFERRFAEGRIKVGRSRESFQL